jgi:acyl transferase domain-containing protein/phosphopantetheinyl transferase (holo-ACP synthase)
METKSDIAIVGMSIYCPGADNIDEFWNNLINGVDSITDVPNECIEHFYFNNNDGSIDRFYCRRGGFANPFKVDPIRYGILPIAAEGMDPEHFISLAGVEQALRDAGIFEKKISLNNACIIIGRGNFSGLVALRSLEIIRTASQIAEIIKTALPEIPDADIDKIKKNYQQQQGRYQADTAIGTMPNLIASLVANKFDMHGPAYTVDGACASGLIAVNHSIRLLQSGQCDIAVAGGLHSGQSAMFWSVFNMMGAMSRKQQISPFSEDADGLLIGQGGGMVVLKTLDRAIKDGDRIYAVIKGTSVCSDGGGSHVMVTSVQGQKRALSMAWENAGMNPLHIGYIEAHGTATPIGDKTEIAALTEYFGNNTRPNALVGSVKSNIGHTMPAAGMIGLIKTALALYHRQIPPTLHCEKPLKAIFESRFSPVQKLTDWDESQYPLIAGVNAFGFGGINAHAVVTAYQDPNLKIIPKPQKSSEEAIAVSASSKEQLIKKLKAGEYTHTGGDYRIVIFNPDKERIEKAISIISKDKAWKGRLDIWFSNTPLLLNGGKIAFLFPGFNFDMQSETDSISDYFDYPRIQFNSNDALQEQSVKHFYISLLSDLAMGKLGVHADMYAGHSLGEWHATRAAGLVSEEFEKITTSLKLEDEKSEMEEFHFVAIGLGFNYEKINIWCNDIPNLYLANDNCPSQMLLCGTTQAKDLLIEKLKKEQIYYQVLPYQSGFHTPFIADKVEVARKSLENIEIKPSKVPVWSATTLDVYPTNKEEFVELVIDHLIKPVRFRELIEKLYEKEKARVFIQIGLGGLVGFVDDILKGKEYSAISSSIPTRLGIDQLKRIMALLYIEGKEIDYTFLGVKIQYQIYKHIYTLPIGAPLTREFSFLRETIKQYYVPASAAKISSDSFQASKNVNNPILQVANENLCNAVHVQDELIKLFAKNGYLNQANMNGFRPVAKKQTETSAPQKMLVKKTGTKFEETLRLTLDDHPYLEDHSIIRQPKGWKHVDDLNPVVPLTMTIELLAEIAQKQEPNRKIIKIASIAATKWIPVEKPFEGKVIGTWKSEDKVSLELQGYAFADIIFGDQYPEPPAEYEGKIDIGKEIMPTISKAEVYDRYTFHGPDYQSNQIIKAICERGILCISEKERGKASLLDNFGQILGLFLHLTETENTISFPVRVKEINFYQNMFDQKGSFEQTTIVKSLTSNFSIADIVNKRDGKIWAVAKSWVGQRFELDQIMWDVILKPNKNTIAHEIAPNVYYYYNAYSKMVSWFFLYKRYLNYLEKQHYDSLSPNKQKEYIISRIALKDAVRKFKPKDNGEYRFPVEIFMDHDHNGKPYVYGYEELEKIEVSLSHKEFHSVAIASNKPVGIDIEMITERDTHFMEIAFTSNEIKLLNNKEQVEWIARFWVAKEAYGKMLGTGLKGNPKQYEIQAIEGEILNINGVSIKTMKLNDNFIVGWTI